MEGSRGEACGGDGGPLALGALVGGEGLGDVGERDVAAARGLGGGAAGHPEGVDRQAMPGERERPREVLAADVAERPVGAADHEARGAGPFSDAAHGEPEADGTARLGEHVGEDGQGGLVAAGAVEGGGEREAGGVVLGAEGERVGGLGLDVEAGAGEAGEAKPPESGADVMDGGRGHGTG